MCGVNGILCVCMYVCVCDGVCVCVSMCTTSLIGATSSKAAKRGRIDFPNKLLGARMCENLCVCMCDTFNIVIIN